MKTIYLKVEIPDTIPDPDLMVSARVKDTFDEWEELNFEEINMQTEGKTIMQDDPFQPWQKKKEKHAKFVDGQQP